MARKKLEIQEREKIASEKIFTWVTLPRELHNS